MQRLAVLGLLLACAASLCSSTNIMHNGKPLMWDQAVEKATKLPSKDGVLTPNPWVYNDRLSLFRTMIAATDPFMGSMGPNTTENPMYGLPVMQAWEYASGRFANPSGVTTCTQEDKKKCISPKSWWACENYYVSVLSFLSAAKQGMFGPDVKVKMQKPETGEDYCTTYDECSAKHPDAMKKWDKYFKELNSTANSNQTDLEKKDRILELYWAARMTASSFCNISNFEMSSKEKDLITSWIDGVEYYAACHHHTNLNTAAMLGSPMPSRVLKEGDVAPNIKGLTPEENHTVLIFHWTTSINNFFSGPIRLWKMAMCSPSTREQGRKLMNDLWLKQEFPRVQFMTMMVDLLQTC